ncbi:aminotransferase class IV [Aestuariivirga sp.]|uniref:aminotransferase class IV n=1 Tax=Aestuariivirga sp. TaxID=2650926 RepID=UPI0039E478F3
MSFVWSDGALHQHETISVSPKNRGLTLGDGLFETILAVNRVALWREEHLARLKGSAQVLGLGFPADEITQALDALLAAGGENPHVLRLTLTRGATARGLGGASKEPVVIASLDPFDTRLIGQPATLVTSKLRRSTSSIAATHKTLSYADNIAAAREAEAAGADDALLLNTDGHVACTTIANIFVVKGKRLITPARSEAILPGIMRGVLLAEAKALGFTAEETTIAPRELQDADAVFLTNSLRLVRPVTRIDGTPVASGAANPILDHLSGLAAHICQRTILS